MKKMTLRALSLLLGILFLCPLLTMFAGLETAATDGTYFIFDALSAESSSYAPTAANRIELPLSVGASSFTANELTTMGTAGSTNALYLLLINQSNATSIRVDYEYFLDAPDNETVYHTLSTSGEEQELLLGTPNISSRQSTDTLTLSFECEGTPAGSIILLACYDVTVYDGEDATDNDATITRCEYVAQENAIKIDGEVSVSATMRYEGATLALFALSPEDRDFYLFSKTDVARTEVGRTFSFSVGAETAEEIFARYLVAVVTETGERIPLSSPVYPDIPTGTVTATSGFKGYHTDSLFSVIDSGAGVEIVDVYLDRLNTTQNSDNVILYAGDHDYYYFDSAAIGALDHRIRNLKGAGFTVYLRFLVSADANGLSFVTHTDSETGIVNKGIDVKDESALLDIHALTDFLTARYSDGTVGKIDGIILGRRADRSSSYFYIGNQDLGTYAESYAAMVGLIAGSARMNIPGLQIIVPVSDRAHTGGITDEHLMGDYFSDLFLRSLLAAMDAVMLNPPAISIMAESHKVPEAVDADGDQGAFGTDIIGEFLAMVKVLAASHAFLDANIMYSWEPLATYTEDELTAAYALQYIALISRRDVRSFITDLSLLKETDHARVADELRYIISTIDTAKNTVALKDVFDFLEADPTDLLPSYNPTVWQIRNVIKARMQEGGYSGGQTPIGSYDLFSFSSTTDLLDWYAGYACGDLSVINHALTASLAATDASEYAEIAYHFDGAKDLSFASLMRFSLHLEGNADTPYEVQIHLRGPNGVLMTSTVLMSGGDHEFYLDLSGYTDQLLQVGSIRIMARPLRSGTDSYLLCLGSVKLESATLNDKELADRLASQNEVGEAPMDEGEKRDYTVPILISVLLLVASLAVVAALIIKHCRDKRHGKKTLHTENSEEHERGGKQ